MYYNSLIKILCVESQLNFKSYKNDTARPSVSQTLIENAHFKIELLIRRSAPVKLFLIKAAEWVR